MRRCLVWLFVLILSSTTSLAHADTFGSGLNSFEIEFVPIGNPGNADDPSGQPTRRVVIGPGNRGGPRTELLGPGAVDYHYRIGKYEISEQMIDKANALGGLGITKDTRGPDKPATNIDWFEAARFVNWLNISSGHTPAYKFDLGGNFQLWEQGDAGYNPDNLFRNRLARYVLPSADEWYKAAYYDPVADVYYDYPTGSNAPPTAVASGTGPNTAVYRQDISAGPADIFNAGGVSPYGTMAQGGNVDEWEETDVDLINDDSFALRGRRGGNWDTLSASTFSSSSRFTWQPTNAVIVTGFRVASIPEPNTVMLFGLAGTWGIIRRSRP